MPAVSIVVPVHNGALFLLDTLVSIAGQTDGDFECVIVDDGSTDDSLAIARAFAREDLRFRVLTQPCAGVSGARNRGYRALDPCSPYVAFIDADDIWLPDALSTLRRGLEDHPDCVGAHALAEWIDATGREISRGAGLPAGRARLALERGKVVVVPANCPTDFRMLSLTNVVETPGVALLRHPAVERIGPWDETLHGTEDWDMMVRLSRLGDFAFADRVILQYRQHDGSRTSTPDPEDEARMRSKLFYSPENSPEQEALVRSQWRRYDRWLIERQLRHAWLEVAGRRKVRHPYRSAAVYVYRAARPAGTWLLGRPVARVETAPARW